MLKQSRVSRKTSFPRGVSFMAWGGMSIPVPTHLITSIVLCTESFFLIWERCKCMIIYDVRSLLAIFLGAKPCISSQTILCSFLVSCSNITSPDDCWTNSKGIEPCVARRNQAGQWPIYILFAFFWESQKLVMYAAKDDRESPARLGREPSEASPSLCKAPTMSALMQLFYWSGYESWEFAQPR